MTRLWSTVQADHDLVWVLLNRLTGGKGEPRLEPGTALAVARDLVALESVHEAAEELVLWPAVRQACREGDDLVDNAQSQEAEAKRALNELRRISAGTLEFDDCVHTVAGMARTHLSYEQNQVWPRLADALSDANLDRLADQWDAARAGAPTRPHPHTPARPLLLGTAGKLVAAIDRARDALTGRQVPTPGPGGVPERDPRYVTPS